MHQAQDNPHTTEVEKKRHKTHFEERIKTELLLGNLWA